MNEKTAFLVYSKIPVKFVPAANRFWMVNSCLVPPLKVYWILMIDKSV